MMRFQLVALSVVATVALQARPAEACSHFGNDTFTADPESRKSR